MRVAITRLALRTALGDDPREVLDQLRSGATGVAPSPELEPLGDARAAARGSSGCGVALCLS